MKKNAIITGAALLLFTAALNAQTDTVPAQPEKPVSADKYNNWNADTYKMQPMPEGLTMEKKFPVIGKYQLTDKEGTVSTVMVTLDETNKGTVWIEGLPQGKIKGVLRKSPATYKIPVQPLAEEALATEVEVNDAKTAMTATAPKELPEGVLIYDKDANVLNVCIGCKYNNEDPAMAFTAAEATEAAPMEEMEKAEKKTVKTAKTAKAKIVEIKPVHYTGTKVIEATAVAEVQK